MKFGCVLSLSVKNIFLKKSAYLKAVAGFFFAFLIIFIVLFYSGSLNTAYKDYRDNRMDRCMYRFFGDLSAEQEKEIRAFEQVTGITARAHGGFPTTAEAELEVDGKKITVKQEDFQIRYDHIKRSSNSSFQTCVVTAFSAKTGENLIKYGRDLKNEEDILISENLLEAAGINGREELIGKSISLYGEYTRTYITAEGEEERHFTVDMRGNLSGIINGKFADAFDWYYGSDFVDYMKDGESATWTDVSLKSFSGNEEFFEKMNELFPEDGDIDHFFDGAGTLSEMKTVEGQQMLCNRFLSLIAAVLFVVICVYVASNQFYLLQKNSTFYGILKANGVDNKSIFLTHTFEIAITLLVALVLAFAVSVGAFFIIKTLFDDFLGIDLAFSAGIALGSFFGLVAVCALLAFLITLFIYNKILKKPPVQLLKK